MLGLREKTIIIKHKKQIDLNNVWLGCYRRKQRKNEKNTLLKNEYKKSERRDYIVMDVKVGDRIITLKSGTSATWILLNTPAYAIALGCQSMNAAIWMQGKARNDMFILRHSYLGLCLSYSYKGARAWMQKNDPFIIRQSKFLRE